MCAKLNYTSSIILDTNNILKYGYNVHSVKETQSLCNEFISHGMFVGVIYLYTNQTNGKVYVGQTTQPQNRHTAHLSSSREHVSRKDARNPLHLAIKKYGEDNFKYTILSFCAEHSEPKLFLALNSEEDKYIAKYNSATPKYGYNILHKGKVGMLIKYSKEVKQYTKFGEYIATFPSIAEAVRRTGCTNARSAIKDKQYYANGYVFVPTSHELPTHVFEKYKARVIHQYSENGKYLNTFDNAKDAAKSVNGDQSRISFCAKPPCINVAYGFRWSHEKTDCLELPAAQLAVPVCQYDSDGNYVAGFKTTREAAKSIGCNDGSHIALCTREHWRKAGGYYWRTTKSDKINVSNLK